MLHLAFGWFGFHPGSTLGASANGQPTHPGTIAVATMLAGCTGTLGAIIYMWALKGKPDASMSGNGLLAGLVAITAPSGRQRNQRMHLACRRSVVCVSCAFVENS